MKIIYNSLFKIDIEEKDAIQVNSPANNKDLESYLVDLMGKIISDKNRKGFEFESDTTEVRTLLDSFIENDDEDSYLEPSFGIARRLHRKEIESAEKNNLGVPPVKGMLVILYVENEDLTRKIIISKADYNEFLDVNSYKKRDGFPIKKKIYKAFVANIENEVVGQVSVYDTNSPFTVYWYRDFLELKKILSDEHNTEEVFKIIESAVLNPLKKKHKADYLELWNASVRYFRVQQEFDLDKYIEDLLVSHNAITDGLDVTERIKRLQSVMQSANVDTRFDIKPDIIKKKLKTTISLTAQIDLNIKDGIPELDRTIKRYLHSNGQKWIMIRSEVGFEYFKDSEIIVDAQS